MEIQQEVDHVSFNQKLYIKKIVDKISEKPVTTKVRVLMTSTPAPSGIVFPDKSLYRQVIGAILFLSNGTRPDIAFSVRYLARFVEKPNLNHWKALQSVLEYVDSTKDYELRFPRKSSGELSAFVNASYGADKADDKSTTGFAAFFNGGLVHWFAKKQPTTATSSTEAEYIALCAAAKEVIWLRNILGELSLLGTDPTKISEDNQASIKMSENDLTTKRAKHILIRFHYTREQVQNGSNKIVYCPTDRMCADLLTKCFGKNKTRRFAYQLGLRDSTAKEGVEVTDAMDGTGR